MNEIQRMFEQEVRERKSLARQARYVKKGSRSTRCPMSSDYLTPKQMRERNGELMSVNLAQPMPWSTFKKMSQDIQREYVYRLIRQYGTNASDLSKVFGVTSTTISSYCKEHDFGVTFKCGQKMPIQKKAAFERFLSGEESETDQKPKEGCEYGVETEVCTCEPMPEADTCTCEPETTETLDALPETVSKSVRGGRGGLERFHLDFSSGRI